jgi:hypothetical protein
MTNESYCHIIFHQTKCYDNTKQYFCFKNTKQYLPVILLWMDHPEARHESLLSNANKKTIGEKEEMPAHGCPKPKPWPPPLPPGRLS